MPTIAITSAAAALSRTDHPKAQLRAEDGYTITLRQAPTGGALGGLGKTWSALERPGRKPIVVTNGDGLKTLALEVVLGHPDHQVSVEPDIAALERVAAAGNRITVVNLSPREAGPWRIEGLDITIERRQHGTNNATRAAASLRLIEAVDVNTSASIVRRYTRRSLKAAIRYRVKKGDTVRSLAFRYYGDPYAYPLIVKANKLKTTTLKVGKVITIPKLIV